MPRWPDIFTLPLARSSTGQNASASTKTSFVPPNGTNSHNRAYMSHTYRKCFQNRLTSPPSPSLPPQPPLASLHPAWLLTPRLFGFASRISKSSSSSSSSSSLIFFATRSIPVLSFGMLTILRCTVRWVALRDVRGDTDASWVGIGEIRRGASCVRGLIVTLFFVKIMDIYVCTSECFSHARYFIIYISDERFQNLYYKIFIYYINIFKHYKNIWRIFIFCANIVQIKIFFKRKDINYLEFDEYIVIWQYRSFRSNGVSCAQSYGKTFLNGASVEKNCRSRISLQRCRKADGKENATRRGGKERSKRSGESGCCVDRARMMEGVSPKMAATEAAASTSRAATTTSSQASFRSASANRVTVLLFCILDPSRS